MKEHENVSCPNKNLSVSKPFRSNSNCFGAEKMMGHRGHKRRPYIGKLDVPMSFCSYAPEEFEEVGSSSRFATTNKIIQIPINVYDKWKSVNDWVATGTYAFGCPSAWDKYPERIHFLAEYTDEDQTFPPYRPKDKKMNESFSSEEESNHQGFEGTKTPVSPVPSVWPISHLPPIPQALEVDGERKEFDMNNSNEMRQGDFIEDSEEIVYDPWIMYLYPPIPAAPENNNEPLWIGPETYANVAN